jgi:hypothetical protein
MITTTPEYAGGQLAKLCKRLDNRAEEIERHEAYYDGHHNLRFATRKFREAFGALFREFSDNWTAVVCDAVTERMKVEGFRFPVPDEAGESEESAEAAATTGDTAANDLWQRNYLDLYSDMCHETMLVTGHAYAIVGPQDDGSTDNPLITVEHPLQVITAGVPGVPRARRAAAKRWWDDETEKWMATLYLPDSVWKYQAEGKGDSAQDKVRWEPREGVEPAIVNPFNGIVPVVPFKNREKLLGHAKSEIQEVIPLQDAVNKLFNDALVASEFAAFRQRLLTGMEIPEDENGNVIPDYDLRAAISRIMVIKDPNVGVHEFQVSDLSQYSNLITLAVHHIAARTRTPPQYFQGQVVNVSGDALKAAESGLVSKVKRRSRFAGESWEETARLGFLLKGDMARAEAYEAETIWSNPEIITESALADSLAKLATLGIPKQALWERLGATQTEIKRWQSMLKEDPRELPPQALAALLRAGAAEAE